MILPFFSVVPLTADAAPPDRVVEAMDAGGGEVEDLASADDGGLVAAATGDGVWAVDTDTWEASTWDGCAARGVAVQRLDDGAYTVWVACDDGVVEAVDWVDGGLSDAGAGTPIDGAGTLLGARWDPVGRRLYVLDDGGGAALRIHAILPDDGIVDPAGYPVQLARSGFVDWVRTDTRLLIAHGGDDMTTLAFGATAPTTNLQPFPYAVADLAPSIRDTAYAVDGDGLVLEYQPGSGSWFLLISGGTEASAIGVSGRVDDEWLLVSRGEQVEAYLLSDGSPVGDAPEVTFDAGGALSDIVVGPAGTALGARGGEVVIMTANPWVRDVSAVPAVVADGEAVTVAFDVDVAVDWAIRLASPGGPVLADGRVGDGGGRVEAVVTADDRWTEGANRLVVVATDAAGRVGTGGVTVTLDNPPEGVPLTEGDLGFGDGRLVLTVPPIADPDIARIDVYVTTTPFSPEDWPSGGPGFDGWDDLATPIGAEVTTGRPTEVSIEPLTNGVQYYVAVRAVDAGGLEGPMSAVLSDTPRPTFAASEIIEDPGGPACATLGFAGVGVPILVISALLTRRRRGVLVAAALVAAVLVSTPAAAEPRRDETDAWFDVELAFGSVNVADPTLQVAYGRSGHTVVRGEFGTQIYRVIEVDLGLGYSPYKGYTLDAAGQRSAEPARFLQLPVSLDTTFRLHVLDEQALVPFVRAGLDYVLWRETWGAERAAGAKAGFHHAVGLQLLLDTFAPGRASRLEAGYGINDTWLTVEWRQTTVVPGRFLRLFDNSAGTDLSTSTLTVGLKLDY